MKKKIEPNKRIAYRIQELFDKHNLTDLYVAAELDMSEYSIRRYRNAVLVPHINFIIWLCDHCKVSADWLLGIDSAQKRRKASDVAEQMCDEFCKYPHMQPPKGKTDDWLCDSDSPCNKCPLVEI